MLYKSFQENFFWLNPLLGSTYITLPHRLKNSIKGLKNIKNNGNKYFLWCHIRHLNPLKIHPERMTKADKNMVNDLDYKDIKFLSLKKIFARLKSKIVSVLMYLVMKITWFVLFIYHMKKFKNCMGLLMITDGIKSHNVYIKDFVRFMCHKTKNRSKKALFQVLFTIFWWWKSFGGT